MSTEDFKIDHLDEEAQRVAKQVMHVIRARSPHEPSGGGCSAFHMPRTWMPEFAGKDAPEHAVLAIAHDGGDARIFFNYDYCEYESIEVMREALERIGYWSEQQDSWYSLVFRSEKSV